MTRDQAVAQIQQGLGWRSDKATEIAAAITFAQQEREKPGLTLPWWLKQEDQDLAVLSGNQVVSLPTGFIKEVEEKDAGLRYRATATGRTFFLKKDSYEALEKYFFGDWSNNFDEASTQVSDTLSPGSPKAYCLRENSIRIYPIPDADYTLQWDFWGADTPLTSGTQENQWLLNAPWVLIGDAGMKMASDLRDKDALATFTTIQQGASGNLFRAIIAREEAGRNLSMGSKL